ELARLPAGDSDVPCVAFSPTASLLVYSTLSGPAGNRSAKLHFWDPHDQKIVAEFPLSGRCRGLVFSSDGHTLATATDRSESRIPLWEVPSGKQLANYDKQVVSVDEALPLAATRDLRLIAYAAADGTLRVFDAASGREQWNATAADDYVTALA